jgi:membrane protease YdiL (CAAX protease family)
MALGWHRPTRRILIAALTAGFVAASAVTWAGRSAGEPLGRTSFLQVALLLATVGPIIEETVFRGFLLPLLRNDIGVLLSVLIVAILFACSTTRPHRCTGPAWCSPGPATAGCAWLQEQRQPPPPCMECTT